MNNSEFLKAIYNHEPWQDGLAETLQEYRFEDSKKAWGIILALSNHCSFPSLFPEFFTSFLKEVASSYQPDLAL
ncbi:MAG TPA: hypothetical protein QGF86_01175, partial [Nitrospinaceae bacterium]|nr:hypothetical protein [Nitrospinaceae bacterium]